MFNIDCCNVINSVNRSVFMLACRTVAVKDNCLYNNIKIRNICLGLEKNIEVPVHDSTVMFACEYKEQFD